MTAETSLVCQDCGVRLRRLTADEVAQVAAHPHNFIVFCPSCEDALREEAAEMSPRTAPSIKNSRSIGAGGSRG